MPRTPGPCPIRIMRLAADSLSSADEVLKDCRQSKVYKLLTGCNYPKDTSLSHVHTVPVFFGDTTK